MNDIYRSAQGGIAVRERYQQFLQHWPVPHRRHRMTTREGETFAIECGPVDAPALVLLHGSGFNSVTWMGDVGLWSEQFRVVAVDVIGEPGLSSPSRPPFETDRHAAWLDDVLDALGIGRASFAGLSLGGWLALDYAVRRPARVASLVLLAPGGVGRPRMRTLILWLTIMPLLLLGDWGRRKALDKILSRSTRARTAVEIAVDEFLLLIFRHFRPRTRGVPLFADAQLERLRMPVLLIVGGRDAMIDSEETRQRLAKHVPHAEIRFLPDVSHAVIGQGEPVRDFLQRAVYGSSASAKRAAGASGSASVHSPSHSVSS